MLSVSSEKAMYKVCRSSDLFNLAPCTYTTKETCKRCTSPKTVILSSSDNTSRLAHHIDEAKVGGVHWTPLYAYTVQPQMERVYDPPSTSCSWWNQLALWWHCLRHPRPARFLLAGSFATCQKSLFLLFTTPPKPTFLLLPKRFTKIPLCFETFSHVFPSNFEQILLGFLSRKNSLWHLINYSSRKKIARLLEISFIGVKTSYYINSSWKWIRHKQDEISILLYGVARMTIGKIEVL